MQNTSPVHFILLVLLSSAICGIKNKQNVCTVIKSVKLTKVTKLFYSIPVKPFTDSVDCCSEDVEQHGLTISAPQEPGKWSLWALTLSPSVGLRFSTPQSVAVFRPLQVEFKLPASLRVGEAVEVDVKIGNNINSCMDVSFLKVFLFYSLLCLDWLNLAEDKYKWWSAVKSAMNL
jgi:hypothetical protein